MLQGRRTNIEPQLRPTNQPFCAINAKVLCSEFGLRAVRYAGGMEADDRIEALNAAHGALTDLGRALCVPAAQLGLNGRLTLYLGARPCDTVAARAARGLWTLNIPARSQSIGTLAHNWAHFLDNHLASAHGFASSAALVQLKRGDVHGNARPTLLTALMRDLVLGANPDGNGFSSFATQSLDADRRRRPPHFSTAPELFARAFEVWLEATMKAGGQDNPFLVSTNGRGLGDYASGVYPQADERQRVAAAVGARLPTLLQAAGMNPDIGQVVASMENLVAVNIEDKNLIVAGAWMAAAKAVHRERLIAVNGGAIYGIEARTKDGSRWGAILPEMSGGGGDARIQFYDAAGLLGHVVYRDEETALRELVAQHYVTPDLGAMDRLQAMPHWHRKIPAAVDAQRRCVYAT
ncbi:MAG: hypothetical protein CVV05_00425 [Gammaproteobacteria bacterium HGW-Gammaproteobacteria-1]|jgi:hypothetical protein|nr:MAG: hypothetical protein CVV05_00425 [Gammaproteobacteria bacterium HGW-Gammaproteobacteria-1]